MADNERIYSAMDISTFLNPGDEIMDDSEEVVFKSVVKAYIKGDRDRETDKEVQSMVMIK